MYQVFVSHSSAYWPVVESFLELIEHGIGLNAKHIFCSSSSDQGIEVGTRFEVKLQQELTRANCVVLIISEDYFARPYCLCELGGAWAQGKKLVPLLVPPATEESLKAVTLPRQALRIDNKVALDNLRDDLVKSLKLVSERGTSHWEQARDSFLSKLKTRLEAVNRSKPISKLHDVLGYHEKRGLIVLPTWMGSSNQMHWKDVYAVGYLLDLHRQAGFEWELKPHKDFGHDAVVERRDTICVASGLANTFTQRYFDRYCPGLRIVDARRNKEVGPEKWGKGEEYYLAAGRSKYDVGVSSDIAVLVKIGDDMLQQSRTIHLVFGLTGTGTAAASYYLLTYYDRLHDAFEGRSYCVVVRFNRQEGHRSVPPTFDDVAECAFKKSRSRRSRS